MQGSALTSWDVTRLSNGYHIVNYCDGKTRCGVGLINLRREDIALIGCKHGIKNKRQMKYLKRISIVGLTWVLTAGTIITGRPCGPGNDSTLQLMKKVGDWQLNTWARDGVKYGEYNWVNAVCYTGLFALGRASTGSGGIPGLEYRPTQGYGRRLLYRSDVRTALWSV
jgi:hypothetical protein